MSDDVVTFWSTPWLYTFPFSIDDDGTVWTHCAVSDDWGSADLGWEPVQQGPLPLPAVSPLFDPAF